MKKIKRYKDTAFLVEIFDKIEDVRCLDAGQAIDTEADNMLAAIQTDIMDVISLNEGSRYESNTRVCDKHSR